MKTAIIGPGRQGNRRAKALLECGDEIACVLGVTESSVNKFSKDYGCEIAHGWKSIVNDDDVDAVLICTPNDTHVEFSISALNAGKHVLCEKPIGRNPEEAKRILDASKNSKAVFKSGFNHRYHPAIMQAKKHLDSGKMGKILFIRSRYGITGRANYEQDWRAKPNISGGGQLMDQGQHTLDLLRWFGGDISEVNGYVDTLYWNIKPLEDNAFCILKAKAGHTCMMHVNWTEWKNLFSFEIFGKDGYAKVEGLGGSYGKERLITGVRDFNAPFVENVKEFDQADISWKEEWKDFTKSIKEHKVPMGTAEDGYETVKLAYSIYESSKTGKTVKIK